MREGPSDLKSKTRVSSSLQLPSTICTQDMTGNQTTKVRGLKRHQRCPNYNLDIDVEMFTL